MTDNNALAEHLEGMAEVIEEHGHVTGQPGSPEVGFCLVGAARYHRGLLTMVVGEQDDELAYHRAHERWHSERDRRDDVDDLTNEALGLSGLGETSVNSTAWRLNDCTPLTKETALELLTTRAKELRNEG